MLKGYERYEENPAHLAHQTKLVINSNPLLWRCELSGYDYYHSLHRNSDNNMKTIKGYKAYDKGLKCKNFQFKVGEIYEEKEAPSICNNGFHFCENPLDVLNYYNLCDSEFTEVEALGKIDKKKDEDTKISTNKIKIGAKLDLSAFVKASIDFIFEKSKVVKDDKVVASSGYYAQLASSGDSAQLASSGNSAQLASSGDSAQLASSGNSAKLASSGYYAQLELNGEKSVGASIGINGIIKGKKGNWITLAEYNDNNEIKFVLSAQIDGKKIKEDTWYKLQNKKLIEVK